MNENKTNINWYKPTYGKLLYEAINEEVAIKKLETDILTIFLRILNTQMNTKMNIGMLWNFQKFQNIKTGENS